MRHKRPAEHNIGIDADHKIITSWSNIKLPNMNLVCSKAEDYLSRYEFNGGELIYVDPPYHPKTRRQARVYTCDYSVEDHESLLKLLISLPCMIILSGYDNSLYKGALTGWQTRTFLSKTHTDVREETLWFNFDPPQTLHDSRYLGENFRERQATKRRLQRLQEKFSRMDPVERAAISQWLYETYPCEFQGCIP